MKKVLALLLALCMTLCVAQAAMADMLSDIQEKGTLVVGATWVSLPMNSTIPIRRRARRSCRASI